MGQLLQTLRDIRVGFRVLQNDFGEEFDGPCDACDVCAAGITVKRDPDSEPFLLNSRVAHAEWGEGQIVRYEGDKMVVLFDQVGYKTLAIDIVTERELLTPAE